jgi:hypothetical protein
MTTIEVSHPEIKTFHKVVADKAALEIINDLRAKGFTARIVAEQATR